MSPELILQLLSLIPAFTFGNPEPPPTLSMGAGTIMIAACRPGERVEIQPGDLAAVADSEGVAKLTAPAQVRGSAPYQVNGAPLNGTVDAGEILSGICP